MFQRGTLKKYHLLLIEHDYYLIELEANNNCFNQNQNISAT